MRLLGRRARVTRDLLAQALEGRQAWQQIVDDKGRLLWSSQNGSFGAEPDQPLLLWLQEALGTDREQLRRLHALQSASERRVSGEERFHLSLLEGREFSLRLQPLAGPPRATHWSLESRSGASAQTVSVPPDLLEAAELGLYQVDEQGALLHLNEPLARWLGRSHQDMLSSGQRICDFLFEAFAALGPPNATPSPAEGGAPHSGRYLVRGAKGTLSARVTSLPLAKGRGGALGLVQRLEALAEEAGVEGALQRLSEEAPVGVARLSPTGSIVECNRAFASLLGCSLEEAAGKALGDYIEPGQRNSLAAALEEVAGAGSVSAGTSLELRLGSPVRRIVSLVLRSLPDVDGLGAYLLDLTEKKNFEARAAQSEKMQAVGQLAGGIAHDFNNLLTAIIGFSDLLLARYRPGDPSFSEIMQIKQNANRAAGLVRQLLAFSRQQSLQPKILSLTNILEDITHLLRRLIGQRVELEVVHERDLWPVKADQGQLDQVIINLAINARDSIVKASAEKTGYLQIRTYNLELRQPRPAISDTIPKGDYVLLEVADNGEGIPPENIERVFEPFFSTKEVGEGTGLGLSTVYGIVKQTGGYISIESEMGVGTRFLIYLPRYADAMPEEVSEEKPRPRDLTGRGCILLVEDEDAVRAFSATTLRNKGYEVIEAASGEEALTFLQDMEAKGEKTLDLLITDVVMPRIDGPTLVREARQRQPTLKVIYISGYAEDSLRSQLGEEQRQAHYLPKPFSLKQLAARVKEVMQEGSTSKVPD